MYTFQCEKFGMCRATVRAQTRMSDARVVEVETTHGVSRTVSIYRYINNASPLLEPSEPNNAMLCRYAIAQFLRRSERLHVARVEVLDTSVAAFAGPLSRLARTINTRTSPIT